MNPIAIGCFLIGAVLLLYGIFSLTKSKKTAGMVFSVVGVLVIALPFVATALIAE